MSIRVLTQALALAVAVFVNAEALADAPGKFVVVSDIHFDPFDPPELAAELAATEPAQWDAIFAGLTAQAAARYGADTNYALLRSALAALSRAAAEADFVVVPGDVLAHRFEHKAAAALAVDENAAVIDRLKEKTTVFVAGRLREAISGKPLILALGNNDADCGDYRLRPAGAYLAATARAVGALAVGAAPDPDFDETYRLGGYYALRHPTLADTVIIVLGNTLWSARYEDACADRAGPDGAAEMLAWFEKRLARAQADGDRVWLVRHIPAGIDAYSTVQSKAASCADRVVPFVREPYATRFPELLRRYADLIQVSLTGHVHHDSYRLVTDDAGSAIDVDKIVPAISPIFGQNPGFQIFDYDTRSGEVTDFETRFLTDPGTVGLDDSGTWRTEYRFTDAYGLTGYTADNVERLWLSLGQPGPARDGFARFYPVSRGVVPAGDLQAYTCAIRYHDVARYTACHCGG